MKAVLPALARPLIEEHLPDDLTVIWFEDREQAEAAIADADIAWVDMQRSKTSAAIATAGEHLKWLFTIYAGVDPFDLNLLRERGTVLTNGVGINAVTVAEYAVLGVLAAAKRFDEVVRLADGHEWTTNAPGKIELDGTSALIIGYGTIGKLIGDRLTPFGVDITGVTRSGRDGTLTPDQWRDRLGEFDWVILAAPSTDQTHALIGDAEFEAMKRTAWLINIARGDMIDQEALIPALNKGRIGGAFLDTVTPEPLPEDHPLWTTHNIILTMHLAGRSQTKMFQRAADLFLSNLTAFREGKPMQNVVDLGEGY